MASTTPYTDPSNRLTRAEVSKNNTPDSLWTIIDHRVYDLTDFADAHPGGTVVLLQAAGKDSTEDFYNLHRHSVLQKYRPSLCIGVVEGESPEVVEQLPGDLSAVPYAEPLWLMPQFKSPYYKESHHALRREMRVFVDTYITPEAQQKELDGTTISQSLIDRMAATNILAMRLGPGKHLHGRELLGGAVRGEDFDYFHDLLVAQEIARANARGFQDGNMAGMMISLTAVQQWLRDDGVKARVTDEVLSGRKKICLAVSEAFAGSDVAGIRTTAERTPDGKFFVVNGTKKWITNGTFCDYFVTGCKSSKGFTVLLIPRGEGVETSRIKTSYSAAAGTAYVQFEDVKVPADHLLGEEHRGFAAIMSNFNHERWSMTCMVARWCRTVTEECLKWANQRVVFGKKLIDQPVVRAKLARMITLTESLQSYLESLTYQLNTLSYTQQNLLLSGPIALLKSHATQAASEVAGSAVNIFGGRGLTQTGMGNVVEMFQRTYKFDAILGGAEEVLADLGVRQAVRGMPVARL